MTPDPLIQLAEEMEGRAESVADKGEPLVGLAFLAAARRARELAGEGERLAIPVAMAPRIDPDSWLNDSCHADFQRRYRYACTQTHAIRALANLTPEDAFHLYEAFRRGGPASADQEQREEGQSA